MPIPLAQPGRLANSGMEPRLLSPETAEGRQAQRLFGPPRSGGRSSARQSGPLGHGDRGRPEFSVVRRWADCLRRQNPNSRPARTVQPVRWKAHGGRHRPFPGVTCLPWANHDSGFDAAVGCTTSAACFNRPECSPRNVQRFLDRAGVATRLAAPGPCQIVRPRGRGRSKKGRTKRTGGFPMWLRDGVLPVSDGRPPGRPVGREHGRASDILRARQGTKARRLIPARPHSRGRDRQRGAARCNYNRGWGGQATPRHPGSGANGVPHLVPPAHPEVHPNYGPDQSKPDSGFHVAVGSRSTRGPIPPAGPGGFGRRRINVRARFGGLSVHASCPAPSTSSSLTWPTLGQFKPRNLMRGQRKPHPSLAGLGGWKRVR